MGFCPKLMVLEKIMTSLILAAVNLYENIISDHKLKVMLNPVMERHKCSMVADKSSGNDVKTVYLQWHAAILYSYWFEAMPNQSFHRVYSKRAQRGCVVCRRLISGVRIYFQQLPVRVDCFHFKALRFKTTSTKASRASVLSASFCLTSLQ